MQLVKYRDAEMITHTWFYVDDRTHAMVSPFFESEQQALAWFDQVFDGELEPNDAKIPELQLEKRRLINI